MGFRQPKDTGNEGQYQRYRLGISPHCVQFPLRASFRPSTRCIVVKYIFETPCDDQLPPSKSYAAGPAVKQRKDPCRVSLFGLWSSDTVYVTPNAVNVQDER